MALPDWMRRGPARAIERGREHVRRAELEAAAECFARAAREAGEPGHPLGRRALQLLAGVHVQRGLAEFHRARYAAAEREFDRALAADPEVPAGRECRARIYYRSGRLAEAVADLDRALAARPREADLHLLRAACLEQCRDRHGAADALDMALALAERRRASARGGTRALRGRWGRARAECGSSPVAGEPPGGAATAAATARLSAAVRAQPFYADLRYRLAGLLAEAGRVDEAEAQAARALEINPRYLEARLLAVRLRLERRAAERAVQDLELETRRHSEYADLWYWLGFAYLETGEAERAREALERALALNRRFARAHRLLALAHHRAGRLEVALRCVRRGFLGDRELPGGVPGAGGWRSVRDGDERAPGEIERAVFCQPGFPDLHVGVARARRARGEAVKAREACRLALSLNPDYGAAALELASLELELSRPAVAERLLARLVQRHPRWSDAWALLAEASRLRGGAQSAAGATAVAVGWA